MKLVSAVAILGLCVLAICSFAPTQTKPSAEAAATAPANQPASAPSPQELEQARTVFQQVMNSKLTDAGKARISKLIVQLGSDNWKDREEAEKALSGESAAALSLIRQAANNNDLEIARRVRIALSAVESRNSSIAMPLRKAIAMRQAASDASVVGDVIALLTHDDLSVRGVAGWGLLRLTGQNFGFAADAEPDKLKQAAQKATEWWEKNKGAFVLKAPVGPKEEISLDVGGGITMELVLIPAGKFMMGSPADENAHQANESPQHEVTISKPFYMGIYEVTQEQYEQVMGKNPSNFKGPQNPVETVSWDDAVEFCKKLSQKTGKTVQLPTEAQWEYACRAGSKTRFSYGDADDNLGDYSWYISNIGNKTHPVGQKKPNDFGLYDMYGNVWEWCSDWYADSYANANNTDPTGAASGSYRVLRGGGWGDNPDHCRSAVRHWLTPYSRYFGLGFRVSVAVK